MKFTDKLQKHVPILMTVLSLCGLGVTIILTAKAAPEAERKRDERQKEKGEEPLTTMEVVRTEAPVYVPAAVSAGTTAVLIIFNHVLNSRRQAQLASAYLMLAKTFKTYRKHTEDLFGPNADYEIRKSMVREEAEEEHEKPYFDEVQTFYLEPYGKCFERTREQVMDAEYHTNRNFVLRGYSPFNEFLEFLDLEPLERGNDFGWSMSAGCAFYGYEWIDFEHRTIQNEDGTTCCEIVMPFEPTGDYLSYDG